MVTITFHFTFSFSILAVKDGNIFFYLIKRWKLKDICILNKCRYEVVVRLDLL
jgi:hypothetical protein